jgi:hypothetical protein
MHHAQRRARQMSRVLPFAATRHLKAGLGGAPLFADHPPHASLPRAKKILLFVTTTVADGADTSDTPDTPPPATEPTTIICIQTEC